MSDPLVTVQSGVWKMTDEAGVTRALIVGPEGAHLLSPATLRATAAVIGAARDRESLARACQAALGIEP